MKGQVAKCSLVLHCILRMEAFWGIFDRQEWRS